jgi:ribose 5-phosphate isomerase A
MSEGTQQRLARPAIAPPEEDPNAIVVCSSPPCFMHELDPSYLGYLGRDEVRGLLEGLLVAKWSGTVVEAAWVRAMLRRHHARLGATRPLPVEVVRFAWPTTRRRLLDLLPSASLRRRPGGDPFVTDEGHHVLDCDLPATDLPGLAAAVKATLGVVEHGLFIGQADEVLVGQPDGTVRTLTRRAGPGGG